MEIINFDEQLQGSFVTALFDVFLGQESGMFLRRVRLCRSKAGHWFVQFPSYKKGEFEGKFQYAPYVDFTPERGKDFSKETLNLLKPFIAGLKTQ